MEEEKDSFAMAMLRELSEQNKAQIELNKTQNEQNRLAMKTQSRNHFLTLVIILSMGFSTIMGFLWYLNQYDYTTETYTVESEDNGNAIINDGGDVKINERGDVENGESDEGS